VKKKPKGSKEEVAEVRGRGRKKTARPDRRVGSVASDEVEAREKKRKGVNWQD